MKKELLLTTLIVLTGQLTYNLPTYCQSETKTTPPPTKTPPKNIDPQATTTEKSSLSLRYAEKKIEEASKLFQKGDLDQAYKVLFPITEWLTQATQLHYELFQVLSKHTQTATTSKVEKIQALDFGQLRDRSYFLLANIYISQNKLQEAVNILAEVIKSQPDSELGLESYKKLQEVNFSDNGNEVTH